MASWKAWKTKTGDRIKKFVITAAITIGVVILLYIAWYVSIKAYKASLKKQIAVLTAELSVKA